MVLRYTAKKSKSFCCSPSAAAARKYPGLRKEKRASCLTVLETECPRPLSTIDLVFGFREGLLAAGIRMGGAHVEEHTLRDKKPERLRSRMRYGIEPRAFLVHTIQAFYYLGVLPASCRLQQPFLIGKK